MRRAFLLSALVVALPSPAISSPRLPRRSLPVPLVRQATDYSCGAAALLSVLFYWNAFDGKESDLYDLLKLSPQDGAPPENIAAAAAHFGLKAGVSENLTIDELRLALERGETPIVDLQAWREPGSKKPWREEWEDGHYAVLVGLDKKNAYLMDPSSPGAYAWLPLDELVERWHDYEDRGGIHRRTNRLAILISGKRASRQYPAPLVRME